MKLNKKVEIAIQAVGVLRKREGHTRTADIATELGTTTPFLEQIMRNLRTAGIVTVKRGPGGGFVLDPERKISAFEVAQAVGRNMTIPMELNNTADILRLHITEAFKNTVL